MFIKKSFIFLKDTSVYLHLMQALVSWWGTGSDELPQGCLQPPVSDSFG